MFALAAAVVFFLALIKVTLGSVSLLYLGLFLISCHMAVGVYMGRAIFGRRSRD